MKRSRHPSRTPSKLAEQYHQRLNMYVLAAGAAGVGLLALAQPAAAEVVCTPAHHPIFRHSSFGLDVNHDGKVDFEINQTSDCSTQFCNNRLYAYVPSYQDPGNAVVGQGNFPFHAYALKRGAPIGPAGPFGGTALYFRNRSIHTSGTCTGSWVNARNRYLGLKFIINGEIHFGWARLSSRCDLKSDAAGVLTGYAYETIANKPIRAGQTQDAEEDLTGAPDSEGSGAFPVHPDPTQAAPLRTLALGARGLPLWRQKE